MKPEVICSPVRPADLSKNKIPSSLIEVIRIAGQENPKDRFQSASEMRSALNDASGSIEGVLDTLIGVHSIEIPAKPNPSQDDQLTVSAIQINQQFKWTLSLFVALFVFLILAFSVLYLSISSTSEVFRHLSHPNRWTKCPNYIDRLSPLIQVGPREPLTSTFKDIDNDGHEDALFVNHLDQNMSIYWGSDSAVFDNPSHLNIGRSGSQPLIGDINQDQIPDLITLHHDESLIKVHTQSQTRQWEDAQAFFQSDFIQKGALFDYNKDGFLDLLMAGWANDQTQRLFFRAGFEDGFHIHQQIGALKLGAFAHHQPLVFSIEADGIYQHTFMPNLTLGERARISDVSGVTSLYISEKIRADGLRPSSEQEAPPNLTQPPC